MARYVLQARNEGRSTASCSGSNLIPDVPCTDTDWSYIRKFMTDGYSAGCGSGNYCPYTPMPREQMAVFLVMARYGPTTNPPACTVPPFNDVPCASPQRVRGQPSYVRSQGARSFSILFVV